MNSCMIIHVNLVHEFLYDHSLHWRLESLEYLVYWYLVPQNSKYAGCHELAILISDWAEILKHKKILIFYYCYACFSMLIWVITSSDVWNSSIVIQAAGGMHMVDPLFQRVLVNHCRNKNIPIIFDEVFTGFWRLGTEVMFAESPFLPLLLHFVSKNVNNWLEI